MICSDSRDIARRKFGSSGRVASRAENMPDLRGTGQGMEIGRGRRAHRGARRLAGRSVFSILRRPESSPGRIAQQPYALAAPSEQPRRVDRLARTAVKGI